MNATDPTTPPATTEPAREYIDVLPTRGGKRQALKWIPHSPALPTGGATLPQAGFVVLTSDRDRTGYAVTESPLRWGRAFTLTKVGGKGTDPHRESYLVECSKAGPDAKGEYDDKCSCKGWERHRHCRHSDGVRTLLINQWL